MVKKNKGGNHINDAHKKPKQQEVVEESNGKRDIGLTIDDDRLGKIDDICPPCKKLKSFSSSSSSSSDDNNAGAFDAEAVDVLSLI
jgi:hypothetical protein